VGLAIVGIAGAMAAWGQQQGMAENVEANEKGVKLCCEKAYSNENNLTAVVTEMRISNELAKRDRDENREAHQQIMDKLEEIETQR
jgi:hypothetical protein